MTPREILAQGGLVLDARLFHGVAGPKVGVPLKFLVDTGAYRCAIPQPLLHRAGYSDYEEMLISDASGQVVRPLYRNCDFLLKIDPTLALHFRADEVLGIPVEPALLGRDFLSHCTLTWDGRHGSYQFAFNANVKKVSPSWL